MHYFLVDFVKRVELFRDMQLVYYLIGSKMFWERVLEASLTIYFSIEMKKIL